MDIEDYRSFDWEMSYLPGVSGLQPRWLRYMMRPSSGTGAEFMKYYRETVEMLRKLMHTTSDLIPIVGSGRAVIDSAINSFLEPGEKALFIDNGYWGRYAADLIAPEYDVQVKLHTQDAHKQLDLSKIEKQLKEERDLKAVHICHVETENGAINPIKQIGELVQRHAPDALYMVDSASAFPGNSLRTDEWGIDVDYYVSHKGLNASTGLNWISVNDKAWKKFNSRKTKPRGWYTSIKTSYDQWVNFPTDGTSRHTQASFPNIILHAIRARLDLIQEMGEENYLKKNEIAGRAIRMGVRNMTEPKNKLVVMGPWCEHCPGCGAKDPNLAGKVEEGRYCSDTILGVMYPKELDSDKFREYFTNRFWMVAPHIGFGDSRKDGLMYHQNGFRIGSIKEDQQYPRNIVAMLVALGMSLKAAGMSGVDWSKGVEEAVKVMEEFDDVGFTLFRQEE